MLSGAGGFGVVGLGFSSFSFEVKKGFLLSSKCVKISAS
ncbi:hypothetical protein C900_00931 [Fulvivirga imtechensis AK7]|uniref:Uncharacterized protein n=1 Tax=Fulvivirga imtechensis AK7 TaxID=1237149 RepID=L8JGX6_9BACT|nr:hypothetical protein C900_00931 [Fulvivirga imtechensis AK7]